MELNAMDVIERVHKTIYTDIYNRDTTAISMMIKVNNLIALEEGGNIRKYLHIFNINDAEDLKILVNEYNFNAKKIAEIYKDCEEKDRKYFHIKADVSGYELFNNMSVRTFLLSHFQTLMAYVFRYATSKDICRQIYNKYVCYEFQSLEENKKIIDDNI